MKRAKAIKLAIKALIYLRKKYAVDANIYKRYVTKRPGVFERGEIAAKKYDEISEAIEIIKEILEENNGSDN